MNATTESRTYVAPGELRADLLALLAEESAVDVLLTSPGLLPKSFEGYTELARQPHQRLPASVGFAHRTVVLEFFAAQIDSLSQEERWQQLILRWIGRIDEGSAKFFQYMQEPLFSRLISRADKSMVPTGPLTLEFANALPGHELALTLSGEAHVGARTWFEQHRSNAVDITSDVRAILADSWAGNLVSPDDVYYKVLAEYFRETLDGMDLEADDNPMLAFMTEFQADAYQYAKGIMRRFGGVFLSDVVGLGKTYIALALLKYLQDQLGLHAVVVAPPALCPTWQDLAAEFRVELRTVSYGKLEKLNEFSDREVLVIDESHNFRNSNTERYEQLAAWLRPDPNVPSDRRVILLSATPQNNRPVDVLHQLKTFPDNFLRLPYRGETLERYFKAVQNGAESLTSLLQHVVVRRTRRFLQQAYPNATLRRRVGPGRYVTEPLKFPTRVSGPNQCLRYSIEATYGKGVYEKIIDTLASLKYPLHGIAGYVRREHADDPRLVGVSRVSHSLRGLFKVLLLKRLESSVAAFKKSLERLRERLTFSLQRLSQGQVVVRVVSAGSGAEEVEEGDDEVMPASMFDSQRLHRDLADDLERVSGLTAKVEAVMLMEDAKLDRLRSWLRARSPTHHRTLIFTQFADTALYLGEKLDGLFGRMEVVTGASGNILRVAKRFAPRANRAEVSSEEQIDLLIATDVMSEGMNLQDADTLINYDLHWNPVRLIQRAGRIDRIGSTNEEIHIASFLPARELESQLRLEEVLRARITEFLKVFGEDSEVLPSDERIEVASAADAYSGQAFEQADASDELDGLGRHAERIILLRRQEPERYSAILAMRPGRRALSHTKAPGLCALRLAWYWGFFQAQGGEIARLDDLVGLDGLYRHKQACGVEGSGLRAAGSRSLDMLVEKARKGFEREARIIREQRAQPSLDPVEEWLQRSLEAYRRTCVASRKGLCDEMVQWVLAGQHKNALKRAARGWRREELAGEALFQEMRGILRRYPLVNEELGEVSVVGCVMGQSSEASS
ncbi:helicase-related protein [Myxococcus sp. AB036A]|uniref:helicase-related protein n=1 Tax=Myxococcus sp. AB036A TaxID=2562793 RepID=UPI00114785FC|nr:helicase-related protein [Myxococcus sp. AB036A]